jgi:hypothetical protein
MLENILTRSKVWIGPDRGPCGRATTVGGQACLVEAHRSSLPALMRSPAKFIVVLSATLAFVGTAIAGGKGDPIKDQDSSARAACLMGDYQKGTKILVDLFIQTGNPVHLFNQGRCYEQNHRWDEALDRFREYLRKAHTIDADTRSYVDQHIAECEAHISKAATVPPPSPPPPPEAPSVAAPVVESPPAPAAAKDTGSTLRIVGIVTAAVGVAALGFGTYEYFRHESLVDDLEKKGDQYSDDQFSDKQNQINDSKTMSWVGFSIGATALVAGATMYILGRASSSSGTEHAAVTLAPGISHGQTLLFLSGAF